MKEFKLSIDMLPKGAWNNDFSKTLSQKDWDTLRNFCYQKANHKCEICGYETDNLNAHEVWEFDTKNKTQKLKDIIGICSACHGVIHFKNSVRMGFGHKAKAHFMKVNKCSEMDFANHLVHAFLDYEQKNKIYRWKIEADLSKFGGKGIEIKPRSIPKIINPYKNLEIIKLHYSELKEIFTIVKHANIYLGAPRVIALDVDNYQGTINVCAMDADRIEWYLDGKKIKTKYNLDWKFFTKLSVENLEGKKIYFKIINQYGYLTSQEFTLKKYN